MRRWLDNVENGLTSFDHQKIEAEGYQMEWAAIGREARALHGS